MPRTFDQSKRRLERAQQFLAGGVSSPFRRSAPVPLFFRDGQGPRVQDVDGNWYLDHALAWGPLILGHRHPAVVEAIRRAAERPHNYGAQHDLEYQVAELLCRLIPCAERVALTSSGSEAVQLALRLARAATARDLVLKFEGHYHGWMDSTLWSYHPPAAAMGPRDRPNVVPGSAGQPATAGENIVVLPWNDVDAVNSLFAARGREIACIITEPVLCNSGCLMPLPGFLNELRLVCDRHGSLLIFDEIITGFRIRIGGAQALFGVTPDIATFGKAIGGGLPLSAVAGKAGIMELIVNGGAAFGGTFNGNCVSLAAAEATLRALSADDARLLRTALSSGERLMTGLARLARKFELPLRVTGFGTAFSLHFSEREQMNEYRDTLADDTDLLRGWLIAALHEGLFLLPDGRLYTSAAHADADIDEALECAERALARSVEPTAAHFRG